MGYRDTKDISTIKAKNVEWVHSSLHFTDERGLEKEEMNYLCDVLFEKMTESSQTIRKSLPILIKNINFKREQDSLYLSTLLQQRELS